MEGLERGAVAARHDEDRHRRIKRHVQLSKIAVAIAVRAERPAVLIA
jgi:hypothetical protein